MTHMLTDEQIEVQVAQLEAERDALLAKTEIVRLGKRKTNHTMIKSMYSTRINRLRRLRGKRYQMPADTLEHRRQVNIERYGYPQGNVKKISAVKKERYGNAFCDQAKARKTKRERWGAMKVLVIFKKCLIQNKNAMAIKWVTLTKWYQPKLNVMEMHLATEQK